MSNAAPSQVRTVDPFASYNSDTVNKLTRMLSFGNDGFATARSCDITLDATSATQVNMSVGVAYKDDMWIEITAAHVVDFTDSDQYYDFGTGFDENGYYYVVMSYIYAKQRPAPEAEILIIKPSQRYLYSPGGEWLFLKAVHVSWNGSSFVIDGVSSYDPDTPANKRLFITPYVGSEITLPTFIPQEDTSRIIYVEDEDDYHFGLSNKWSDPLSEVGGGSIIVANTSGFALGDLVYINSASSLSTAIVTTAKTTADGVVSKVGIDGRVQTTGKVTDVKIQSGRTISVGDLLYLSQTEAGRVTDIRTSPFHQFVGRCEEVIDSTSINSLFVRGEPQIEDIVEYSAYVSDTLQPPNWNWSGGLYYQDVNVSTISGTSGVVMVWDSATQLKIEPESVEFIDVNTLRIWMLIDSMTLHVLVMGPAASPVSATNNIAIYESLPVGSWNLSGGAYYQNVDVSSITTQDAIVMVRDTVTDKVIVPSEIEFDSTSNLKIWMSTNTEDLEVSVMGPTNQDKTIAGLTVILPSGGSWIASGGLYYQDIDLMAFSDNEVVFEFVDNFTGMVVKPAAVEFATATAARAWMPTNTIQLNVTIMG